MDLGATGEHTRARIKALRDHKRMSFAELSRILDKLGRPIPPLGLRRIEGGERRVDVDDLTAIAVALGVSPIALLMPSADQPEDLVTVTGAEPAHADRLWDWLCALEPLPGAGTNWAEMRAASWPSWRWQQFNAAEELQTRKQRFNEELDRRRERA